MSLLQKCFRPRCRATTLFTAITNYSGFTKRGYWSKKSLQPEVSVVKRTQGFSTGSPPVCAADPHSTEKTNHKRSGVTPSGKLDRENANEGSSRHPDWEKEPLTPWPDGKNPHTGELGGPKGPEPTRFGDWERKGRVSDF